VSVALASNVLADIESPDRGVGVPTLTADVLNRPVDDSGGVNSVAPPQLRDLGSSGPARARSGAPRLSQQERASE
jgi:hypothetical protein